MLLIFVASPLLIVSGGVFLAVGLFSGISTTTATATAISMAVLFSIGLMVAQYVQLQLKSGKDASQVAAESIASQVLLQCPFVH